MFLELNNAVVDGAELIFEIQKELTGIFLLLFKVTFRCF